MNESVLSENPEYIDHLEKILDYVENNKEPDHAFIEDDEYESFFKYGDVKIHPNTLHQLHINGFIDKVFDSNSTTAYAISDKKKLEDIIERKNHLYGDGTSVEYHSFEGREEELEGVFDDVVGYEDIKWLLKRGMSTNDITNFLLVGPAGSAKTVFLMCINDLPGSVFVTGSPSSGPGILDTMFEEKPRYMLIDEMDDMDGDVQEVLSQYTETGIVDETKVGKNRKMETNTKTFASANDPSEIETQILDRFTDLHFDPYTRDEFIEVCEHILPRKEGKSEEEATEIATSLWDMKECGDVRQAIQVARLSRGDPEKVIEVLDDYSASNSDGIMNRLS